MRDPNVASRIKGVARPAARPESFPPDSGLGGTSGLRPGVERRGCWGQVKREIGSQPSAGSVFAVDDKAWRDCEGIKFRTAREVGERGYGEARELVRSVPRFVHRTVALEEFTQLLG